MKIIQFLDQQTQRKIGVVEGDKIRVLTTVPTTYALFLYAQENRLTMQEAAGQLASGHSEDYSTLIERKSVLVPLDHPDPYHTWLTGTGLTHLGSAASRNAMHEKMSGLSARNIPAQEMTDSMKMYQLGVENGKMTGNVPASQPEWFYKGNGLAVVHPGQAIPSPAFALDGGEEPEIAGLYINDSDGNPKRIGFALANEFSDHKMERINYLYLAHSKLRPCSYGPELLLGDLPAHIVGKSRILRENQVWWEKEFLTGEDNMSHNIANLEHHHFKYGLFRQPGDVHVHFFGTSVLSFSDQVETKDGDIFEIEASFFGQPLRNPLSVQAEFAAKTL